MKDTITTRKNKYLDRILADYLHYPSPYPPHLTSLGLGYEQGVIEERDFFLQKLKKILGEISGLKNSDYQEIINQMENDDNYFDFEVFNCDCLHLEYGCENETILCNAVNKKVKCVDCNNECFMYKKK